MFTTKPKLKDGNPHRQYELYPLGQIPKKTICRIAKWIIYNIAIGKTDISGEDWGNIFAEAIQGTHLNSPVGLTDVVKANLAWSTKSVKHSHPFSCKKVRVISGRCSPDYSYGISNPYEDVLNTGKAVLGIWNERVNMALDHFNPLRSIVLIRNPKTLNFALYEHEILRFNINEYFWKVNKNNNFEGYRIMDEKHSFTWQPHGSQFTIIHEITSPVTKFELQRPAVLDFTETLSQIGFTDDWVTILD